MEHKEKKNVVTTCWWSPYTYRSVIFLVMNFREPSTAETVRHIFVGKGRYHQASCCMLGAEEETDNIYNIYVYSLENGYQ